jgi:hypothetical protein
MIRKIAILSALACAVSALPAAAATFALTSNTYNVAFVLPDSPAPALSVPGIGFISPTTGTVNGNPYTFSNITFLNAAYPNYGITGGLSFDGSVNNVYYGTQLYSGSETAPTFLAGTYTLTRYGTGEIGTLVISDVSGGAVPEPASWALMLGGFGLVGGAMRRRQRMAVRFA